MLVRSEPNMESREINDAVSYKYFNSEILFCLLNAIILYIAMYSGTSL